jgi:hypothetical protein
VFSKNLKPCFSRLRFVVASFIKSYNAALHPNPPSSMGRDYACTELECVN